MTTRNRRNLRFAATAFVLATGLSLLSRASDTANAIPTGAASTRTYVYRLGLGRVGYVERCCARRWNAYREGGPDLVGTIRRGGDGRWNVYQGYGRGSASRVGYAEPSSGGRWNVYEPGPGRVRAGYLKRSYGNRWDVFGSAYSGYTHEGYVQGPGGVEGGAALLVLMTPR